MAAAAVGALAAAIVAVTVIAAPAPAHITLSASSAASGSTVDGSGGGFSPLGSAVQLHLDQASSTTLWSGPPDRGGAVAFSFTVPAVAAGSHTIVATQTGRGGEAVSGTPATAPLQITAASPPSTAATQSAQPQSQQGSPQQQPGSQPHGPPQPGVSSLITAPGIPSAPATASPPADASAPASAPPAVFSLPGRSATRLTSPPPQVATLWRVGGAVPNSATAVAPVSSPAASTLSREAPSPLTLVALVVLVACAVLLIATTLELRSAERATPAVVRTASQGQRASRRRPPMRSDLWSGSPARLR